MSILAFAFVTVFVLALGFVVASAARRGGKARGARGAGVDSPIWFSDGGAGFSDSSSGADCGSGSSDGGGSCDGGGSGH
jgi:hypothetical protein